MKKLMLKLDGKEMLSKEQMKKIKGGYEICFAYFPGGSHICSYEGMREWMMWEYSDNCSAQAAADDLCYQDECCSWVDCGCGGPDA